MMLNASIRDIPIPPRMRQRPVSDKGFPVPWFVAEIDGQWDFRAIRPGAISFAVRHRLCWLCGQPLGQFMAFVIGPMCSINRVSSEPPSHRDCAEYAVRACPFLANPAMRRNEKGGAPHGTIAGIHLDHNPGATLIWITKTYRPIKVGDGLLISIGKPESVQWYAQGLPATRLQIAAAIDKGMPHLIELATQEGPDAVRELWARFELSMKLLPEEAI